MPTCHVLEPIRFHRLFSSSVEPALRIEPGDSVRTITLDNTGRDADGVERAARGNPLTGPFYVEDAVPGDTLAVTLTRIHPNRSSGHSGNQLSTKAVTAAYHRSARYDCQCSGEWTLDRERGFASLRTPSERLKAFRVKLQPFLGCIGVAPPDGQAIRADCLGSWGGNLDYRRLGVGARIFLPVFHRGALLFIGDGHAAQGDGELTGAALETSMDVEFTVDVIPRAMRKPSRGPRAENAEYLMAFGIAGSLAESLQIATTELATWLERDYSLDSHESALLLGMSIRYEIAEVVDPQANIVASVRKAMLAALDPIS